MSDIERLLEVADSFGEVDVIRDVARRAGLLWICGGCGSENYGLGELCTVCGIRSESPRPRGERECACGMRTHAPQCPVCHRQASFPQVNTGI